MNLHTGTLLKLAIRSALMMSTCFLAGSLALQLPPAQAQAVPQPVAHIAAEAAPLAGKPGLIYHESVAGLEFVDVVKVDAGGDLFIAGTASDGRGCVTRLTAQRTRRWITCFDVGASITDIALAPNLDVYVVGSDVNQGFFAKLSSSGARYFARATGVRAHYSIAIDAAGNTYTTGANVLTKRDAAANSRYEVGFDIDLADVAVANGDAVVTGATQDHDVFVATVDVTGTRVRTTSFGGADLDGPTSIAGDAEGRIYVGGRTASRDFPLRNAVDSQPPPPDSSPDCKGTCPDGFITVLNDALQIEFSSYFGGVDSDEVNDVAVDHAGAIHLVGGTSSGPSRAFPLRNAIAQLDGVRDIFVAKLGPTGGTGSYGIEYSTPLGEQGYDSGLALDVRDASAYAATQREGNTPGRIARINNGPRLPTESIKYFMQGHRTIEATTMYHVVRAELTDPGVGVHPQTAANAIPSDYPRAARWNPRRDNREAILQMYRNSPAADKRVLINTDYFCDSATLCPNGDPGAPEGLFVRRGTTYHPNANGVRAALMFDSDNRASIDRPPYLTSYPGVHNAVGAGPKVLYKGVIECLGEAEGLAGRCASALTLQGYQRRSGACTTADGRSLFLMATDGTSTTTWRNLASFMLELGCTEGMQLAGGAATGLVVDGTVVVAPTIKLGSGLVITGSAPCPEPNACLADGKE